MIDVDHQINAVQRRVGRRTLEAGDAREVTVSQVYDTDLDDLWDAVTNAERIPRWLLPVTGELRLGGRYQLEGNAGGEILWCDPPRGFDATWEYDGAVSWIEVRLVAEAPERTRFTLIHIAQVDEHWEQYGPGATGIGWDLALMGLFLYLSSTAAASDADGGTSGGNGADRLRAEAEAWSASEEGARFMAASGDRWCEADISGGEDAEVARASARRTIDAYTGAESPPSPDA